MGNDEVKTGIVKSQAKPARVHTHQRKNRVLSLRDRLPMSVYILIQKVSETAVEAVFDFCPDGDQDKRGRLKLDKTTGTVSEVIECSADSHAVFFKRAAMKIIQHHLNAAYPQENCWAA